jgi:hypothetical protein
MRSTIALLTLAAALAVGAPAALATTATGSSNGLTVTVALPDTATAMSPFTVSETIANTTARAKIVWVTQTLTGPIRTFSLRYPLFVAAQRTLSFSITFPLPSVPAGTYTLTLTANTASATATTVVS